VPDFQDPAGAFAGGVYFTEGGRDLSGFNVLTFWAKASKSANIDVFGFGNDLGLNTFETTITNVPINTNWRKYYIPIPDPSKLTSERGMFYYSEGPEDGNGYTFWIDEVRFENLGTISAGEAQIFNGVDSVQSAETGNIFNPNGSVVFNLPTGVDQRVNAAPAFFTFSSSDESVASIGPLSLVLVNGPGQAVITANLGDEAATGSLTINSTGTPVGPATAAPTPTVPASDVISFFSNAYNDEPVDFYNGFWLGSDTQSEFIQVDNDDIIRYSQLNFVGIQFTAPTVDARAANRLHIDIWTPDPTDAPAVFKILLFDIGADNAFEGGDDSGHEITLTAPTLRTGEWVSIDLPLSDFPGLTSRANLAQIVLSGDLPNVYADNIYLYAGEDTGGGDAPSMAAPTPNRPAGDVISLFSDAYPDVLVDTWRTEWSMGAFQDVDIAGNPTKQYSALSFAGIETIMEQVDATGMTHFHLDVWSPNATQFKLKLVDFGADGAFDGGDDTEHEIVYDSPAQGEWIGYDIPLSDFTGLVNRSNIAQYILSAEPAGGATLFVDNMYFYNDDGSGGLTEPDVAAMTPTLPAANVISLFSDAYDDVPVDTWRTEWSDATFEDVMIAGNPTKKYSALSFVGIETIASQVDAGNMTHFHVDVWTPDATVFKIKLVDFGPDGQFDGGDDVEHELTYTSPAQGQWVSYEIPLSDFTGLVTRQNIAQYIFVGEPTQASTIFVDNMYFHN
ncbi:MAG: hypothetical protein AAF828_11340, partial [Bacteroidota bacterium]